VFWFKVLSCVITVVLVAARLFLVGIRGKIFLV
jgi:hypothetical protein